MYAINLLDIKPFYPCQILRISYLCSRWKEMHWFLENEGTHLDNIWYWFRHWPSTLFFPPLSFSFVYFAPLLFPTFFHFSSILNHYYFHSILYFHFFSFFTSLLSTAPATRACGEQSSRSYWVSGVRYEYCAGNWLSVCPSQHGSLPTFYGGGQSPHYSFRIAIRVYLLVHLKLHFILWEYQGQVHAGEGVILRQKRPRFFSLVSSLTWRHPLYWGMRRDWTHYVPAFCAFTMYASVSLNKALCCAVLCCAVL